MPPHLADGGLYRPRRAARHEWLELHDGVDLRWPVNEILLESLIVSGKTDAEIAALCNVGEDAVQALRREYDL